MDYFTGFLYLQYPQAVISVCFPELMWYVFEDLLKPTKKPTKPNTIQTLVFFYILLNMRSKVKKVALDFHVWPMRSIS